MTGLISLGEHRYSLYCPKGPDLKINKERCVCVGGHDGRKSKVKEKKEINRIIKTIHGH